MAAMAAPSFGSRAASALLLTFGFFALALGLAGGLAFLAYADAAWSKTSHPLWILLCGALALAILWSILPRWERFEKPGPKLDARRQPRLFSLAAEIARELKQPMVREIYLAPDVNAWVGQRGGILGWLSRPILALGLPLLSVLTVRELRAVLVHEFGHFHHGETALGPWLYRARAAMVRTIDTLSEADSLLRYPFMWYMRMFVKITHATSRAQERAADELASKLAGADAVGSSLKKIHGAGLYFPSFLQAELIPAAKAGWLPPLAEGFRGYLAAPEIARAHEKSVLEEIRAGIGDPYDTHPLLRERLASIRQTTRTRDDPALDAPAVSLLDDLADLERATVSMAMKMSESELKPATWEALGELIYIPQWKEHHQKYGAMLAKQTVLSIPLVMTNLNQWGAGLTEEALAPEHARTLAITTLGVALTLALLRSGWALDSSLGRNIAVVRDSHRLETFDAVQKLADGASTAQAWNETCAALGIEGVDLT
jgi:Zn-dependent protease with chaperone function